MREGVAPPRGRAGRFVGCEVSRRVDVESLESRVTFQGCLFGLCYFHSVMLGRKKFGQQGWSRSYGFNTGDLEICANVLQSYLESYESGVPWQDLRYIFGEIMYGGHIVNDFDRLMSTEYLNFIMKDELLDEMNLFPYVDEGAKVDTFSTPRALTAGCWPSMPTRCCIRLSTSVSRQ